MSQRRRSGILTSAAALLAALVTLLAVGAPAHAADSVTVELRGLGDTVQAGRGDASVRARFVNNTNEPMSGVRVMIAVELEGASPESIRVRREQGGGDLPRSTSGDSVLFADDDPFNLQRGGDQTRRYSISFRNSAPSGEASVSVIAHRDGVSVGTAHGVLFVIGPDGEGQPTTPPNTDPGFVPTFDGGPTYSLAPLPVAEEPSQVQASVPKSLYLLGSLLIIMGGVSLFLIFRPPGRTPARVTGPAPHQLTPAPSWHPRGAAPGPGAGQAWPTVPRPPDPSRRPPPEPRTVREPGPHTARPVRDPGPGEPLPPWLRP